MDCELNKYKSKELTDLTVLMTNSFRFPFSNHPPPPPTHSPFPNHLLFFTILPNSTIQTFGSSGKKYLRFTLLSSNFKFQLQKHCKTFVKRNGN